MTMNSINLAGYVGKDATLRFLPSGTPVTSFRIGQTYRYTDGQNHAKEKTNWFTVVTYGPVAERAAAFRKGDNVVLEGELEQREWAAQDGSKRSVIEVIARNVACVQPSSAKNEQNGAPAAADQEAPDEHSQDPSPVLRRDR